MRKLGYLLAMVTLRLWNLASPRYVICLIGLGGFFVASLAQGESVTVAHRVLSESTSGQPITQMVPEDVTGPSPEPFILEIVYDRASDLLSIHARHAPLAAVLQQISQNAHLSIDWPKTEVFTEQVSVDMNGLPLAQALRELVQGFNYAFLYSSVIDAHSGSTTPRLAKVILLRKARVSVEVHATKEEAPTEGKSGIDPQPPLSQESELIRAVIEKNSRVANAIVESLKEPATESQEREKAVEALLGALKEKDFPAHYDAIALLKDLAPEKAMGTLEDWLQGDDQGMRVIAATGLGRIGDERAIKPLSLALTGNDPLTRQTAANSLARVGGDSAIGTLFQAYLSGDTGLKQAVAGAIAFHADEKYQKALADFVAGGQAPADTTARDMIAGTLPREEGSVGKHENPALR